MVGMVHFMLVNEKHNVGVIVLTNGDISAPAELSREMAETGQDIHMSLFQCLDSEHVSASAYRVQVTHFGLFLAILLFASRKLITS
jgi:hypothetical protein